VNDLNNIDPNSPEVREIDSILAPLDASCPDSQLSPTKCGKNIGGHDTRALQAYLGHKNIQHTVRYTELSPLRFKNFWRT
jgi:hypothetical protein